MNDDPNMVDDPIVEEIRAIRHQLAAQFDNNIHRIAEDLQRKERESGRKYVTLPPRPPRQQPVTAQVVPASEPPIQQTHPATG
jgi:hypothetical protein